jgi:chromosome segregation ATPase
LIEQAMIFALGFLLAGLLALAIAPAFWRRALRLSTRRLEMLLPLSSREIIAERDLLRAEFAVDRRKFEQKAEILKARRVSDMAELGRRAAQLIAIKEKHAALQERHAEQGAEIIAARHAAVDARAQLGVAASVLYSDSGLVERKEADLMRLRRDLAQSQAQASKQSAALADFEALLAIQEAYLTAARDDIARLSEALGSLRLEHEADLATLKATATRLTDREEALKAAESREVELLRRRERQIETSRAAERRLIEKIARIGAEEAAARRDLDAERARSESLAQELGALRRLNAGREAAPLTTEREENAILRQTINEIGAAIIRTAGLSLEPAAPAHEAFKGAETDARAPASANVKATSK